MKRKVLKKQSDENDRANGILVVNRWLKALAAVLGAESAVLP
jgi:hypothetical protein